MCGVLIVNNITVRGPFSVSGFGTACVGLIKVLQAAGYCVRYLPINTNPDQHDVGFSDKLKNELMSIVEPDVEYIKDSVFIDVGSLIYGLTVPGVECKKHILYCTTETTDIHPEYVKMMNEKYQEIWTATNFNRVGFMSSGVETGIKVLPHLIETGKFTPEVKPLKIKNLKGFNFIVNIDLSFRKGLHFLLPAFLKTFEADDDVALVCKITNGSFKDKSSAINAVNEMLFQFDVKDDKNHAPILFMFDMLTDEQIPSLYTAGQCHVSPNLGEGFCTLPDTKILTGNGCKKIINITKNDKVYSHTGTLKSVTNLMNRDYNGEMYVIRPYLNNINLQLTPNHRVLISDYTKNSNKTVHNIRWEAVENVRKNNMVALPVEFIAPKSTHIFNIEKNIDMSKYIKEDNYIYGKYRNQFGTYEIKHKNTKPIPITLMIDTNLSKIFGYYLSEGSAGKYGLIFSLNSKGDDIIRDNVTKYFSNLRLNVKQQLMVRNRENLKIQSIILGESFKIFGTNAHNKHIPDDIFSLLLMNISLRHSFLDAIFEGDGCFSCNVLQYTTVSEQLAEQLKMLLINTGVFPTLTRNLKRGSYDLKISGKRNFDKLSFINKLNYKGIQKLDKLSIKYSDKYFWFPIKSITSTIYDGKVYNISVEKDESYLANGVIVHNCLPAAESMACGLPQIVTRCGGPLDYVNKKSAYWISLDEKNPTQPVQDPSLLQRDPHYQGRSIYNLNPQSLEDQLRYAYINQEETKGKGVKARERIIKKCSLDVLKEKVKGLL